MIGEKKTAGEFLVEEVERLRVEKRALKKRVQNLEGGIRTHREVHSSDHVETHGWDSDLWSLLGDEPYTHASQLRARTPAR
jgi:FtsZ-binding cell division protein ZapB